jgi:hypothetical protein
VNIDRLFEIDGNTISALREKFIEQGLVIPNPVGSKNRKTQIPSTNRPVGPTCPKCSYFDAGCYAQSSWTKYHSMRSSSDLGRSLAATYIAIKDAIKQEVAARLHVSGDFYIGGNGKGEGQIDVEYINGIVDIATRLKTISGRETVAFTYTHIKPKEFEPYRLQLEKAGVRVLYSESKKNGGAIVAKWKDLPKLREKHPEVTFAKCRAQLQKEVSCKDCKLCWEKKDQVCIVFKPDNKKIEGAL